MTITSQQLISLLPLLIVGLTVVVVLLSIAWRRSHFLSATLAVIGLNVALISIWFAAHQPVTDVTELLRADHYALFYSGLVILASLATCTFAYRWLATFNDHKDEFYPLVLIATMGGIVLAYAHHFASLFIGVELLSLPLFGLVGYAFQQKRSLEAAIKYTILSAAASSFMLFGIAFIYAASGELGFSALTQQFLHATVQQPLLVTGFGLLIIGLGFKLSLAPFHLWTPDVYQGAPAPVSTFLATASKIGIFAVLIRLFLSVPVSDNEGIRIVLTVIALASILVGNLMAISQNNLKRLLGYSSIAHFGYLVIALIATSSHELSLEAAGIYLIGYLFSSLIAFGVVSLMSNPANGSDTDSLYSYRGLFWQRPVLASMMAIAMLSLAGIPSTFGFIGKFYLLANGVASQQWWLTAAVVVGSAIGLYYYLRATASLFLKGPEQRSRDTNDNWAYTAGGIVVLFSGIIVVLAGFYPQPLISLVQLAQPLL